MKPSRETLNAAQMRANARRCAQGKGVLGRRFAPASACRYCGVRFTVRGIRQHERRCRSVS